MEEKEVILDETLKDGEYKFYENLGNGYAKEVQVFSRVIDPCIKELQQENAQYKEQVAFHEKYNKEASDQIIKDEEVIKQLKEQRSKAIEYFDSERFNKVFLTFTNVKDTIKRELKDILESNKVD